MNQHANRSKISVYHCPERENIPGVLERIVGDLGRQRVDALFRGKKVLLKPNLCIDFPPERGATTHPLVVDAVICLAKQCGAQRIVVGDGAAVGIRGDVAGKTGIQSICEQRAIPFIDFNREEGRLVKPENPLALKETFIAKSYFEFDTIVNLPVFKSNMLFWISGALKNMKGLLVGLEKHKPHYLGLAECVTDLNRIVRQDLVLMDGFVGMTGNGPAGGEPANARLLIGGFDPVAVDTALAILMGFDPHKVPMLVHAHQAGIGNIDLELCGDPLNSFHLKLRKPLIARRSRLLMGVFNTLQGVIFQKFGQKSRMVVDHQHCTRCQRCVEMCPFHAISLSDKQIVVDASMCQFCMCCTEVCKEHAITLKGLLLKKETNLHKRINL
jgi:uncharacterized protein (DUF362 family)/NAD-dependent dihydropyrimidine dehydrogenase PreA subunit